MFSVEMRQVYTSLFLGAFAFLFCLNIQNHLFPFYSHCVYLKGSICLNSEQF